MLAVLLILLHDGGILDKLADSCYIANKIFGGIIVEEVKDLGIPSGLSTLTSGYMDYVKYVIFDRALVNIDGLKPSQRRILTTMYEIEKAKSLTKCATIVGSTLKLHPHGDCLRGDTMFECLDGSRKSIKELYETGVDSFEVLSYDVKTNKLVPAIAHSFRIGQYTKKVYHVRFENGAELCTTSNHPFLVKEDKKVRWVRADELTSGMKIVSYQLDTKPTRPIVTFDFKSDMLQDIVIPNVKSNYVRHHKNGNPRDNRLANLIELSRVQHASEHSSELGINALTRGRETMFSKDSEIRESIRRKNSQLMSTYNAHQGLYKAFAVMLYMQNNNIPITEENYSKSRVKEVCGIYNATSIAKLKQVYGSFEEVVNLFESNYSPVVEAGIMADHSVAKEDSKGVQSFHSNSEANRAKYFKSVCGIMDMHSDCRSFEELCSSRTYKDAPTDLNRLFDYFDTFDSFLEAYNRANVVVASVEVELVDNEPMYDFTVDGLENAFIPLCISKDGSDVYICIHNSAVYGTLCRMIDSAGYWNVPIVRGKGSFQKSFTTAPSSAARYTECCLRDESKLYFDDMAGATRVQNYDNTRTEPELLPVKYPSVLCNASTGIAVGIASNIPSFNFHDVLNATIEIIETGDLKKPIAPDFSGGPFGGEYVYNESELWSIMRTGRGTLKLRGKWVIDKKTITITEIPYYTTEEAIKKVADNIPEVRSCTSLTDINGMEIQVECMNTQCVESVLQQLIFDSDLQMTTRANIVVILDNTVPKQLGVIDLIKEWVKFRKKVLTKMFTERKTALQYEVDKYSAFVKVVADPQVKQQLIDSLSGVSEDNVEVVLAKILPGVDRSIYTWIADRKIRSLASPHKAQASLASAKNELLEIDKKLADLDGYIVSELKSLNRTYKFPRKTEITTVDYNQVAVEEEVYDVGVTINDKFISKVRALNGVAVGIQCKSDDVIVVMDNQGRIIKIPLKDIPETSSKSVGTYIPTYLKLKDDFQIVNYSLCEARKEAFLYNDGCVSVIDYGEWATNKRGKRVINSGYPASECLFSKFDTTKGYCILQTNFNRVAIMPTTFIEKGRMARTRFVKLKAGEVIETYIPIDQQDLPTVCPMFIKYSGKMCKLDPEDFNSGVYNKLEKQAKQDYWITTGRKK